MGGRRSADVADEVDDLVRYLERPRTMGDIECYFGWPPRTARRRLERTAGVWRLHRLGGGTCWYVALDVEDLS